MERRIAITTAATVALTLLAGGTAIAANVGIIGDQPASGLGETPAVTAVSTDDTQPEVRTIVVDETVPAPPARATTPATSPATTPSSSSHDDFDDDFDDDNEFDDDDVDDVDDDDADEFDDDETDDDDDHDDDEYEGADDDD